jgi:hypothetical protein
VDCKLDRVVVVVEGIACLAMEVERDSDSVGRSGLPRHRLAG